MLEREQSKEQLEPKTALLLTQRRYFLDPREWELSGFGLMLSKLALITRNSLYGAIPHVGIGIVASELSALGYKVDIGDLNNPNDISKAKTCSLVGVSFLDIASDQIAKLIETGQFDLEKTVFGGLGATYLERRLRERFPTISIIAGEAEGLMAEVVQDLETGNLRPKYQRSTKADMSRAAEEPYMNPSYSYRNFEVYRRSLFQAVEVGRGCNYACDFCITAGDKPRLKPLNVVLEDLTRLQRGLGRVVIFVDQNLLAYPHDYLIGLFEQVNKLGMLWAGEGTIVDALINKESEVLTFNSKLMQTMAKNCIGFLIGVEDFSGKVRGAAKMNILQEKFPEIATVLRKYKIPATYSLVFGTDEQAFPDVFTTTVKRVLDLGITILPHIATPRAGTLWEKRLRDKDRIPKDFRSADLNQRYNIVHMPKNMTQEEVLAGYTWLYQQVFNPKEIMIRFQRNLLQCGPKYALGLFALEMNGLTGSMALTRKYGTSIKRYSGQLHL